MILDIECDFRYRVTLVPCVIYSCCNLVTSNITTVINNNNVPIGECFVWVGILSRLVIYLKARMKSLLTQMSRRQSLHSEFKVLMANVMASDIADGVIH